MVKDVPIVTLFQGLISFLVAMAVCIVHMKAFLEILFSWHFKIFALRKML